MLNRISRELTQHPDRPAARAMLFAAGLTEEDLDRPQSGIVSSGYEGNGEPRPDFALNRPAAEGARLLIAGRNFGCGSSREHAVWAIMDHGFDAVLAPSFADIFQKNALRNGLLPIRVDGETHAACLNEAAGGATFTVDLEKNIVATASRAIRFRIDPFARNCLLEGLDELAYILRHDEAIAAFEASNPSGSSIVPPVCGAAGRPLSSGRSPGASRLGGVKRD